LRLVYVHASGCRRDIASRCIIPIIVLTIITGILTLALPVEWSVTWIRDKVWLLAMEEEV
jgi:hypothetical protein